MGLSEPSRVYLRICVQIDAASMRFFVTQYFNLSFEENAN